MKTIKRLIERIFARRSSTYYWKQTAYAKYHREIKREFGL